MVEGLITTESAFGPAETMTRLEAEIRRRQMTVFARIDHAAGAELAGLVLCPTELLIFGNAKAGTPLMREAQTAGIDLPLKALVWQDDAGKTWLSCNDPDWLARRHGAATPNPTVTAMREALDAITRSATALSAGNGS
jgi:uncharacterized protein (DUF302 family)